MKLILAPVIILGLIGLYFLSAALNINNMTLEMLIHNAVRLAAGFVLLGIWGWYKQRLKLKVALYCVLVLLISDVILDYIRDIDNLRFEMMIHDSYMVLWGALIGFIFIRGLKNRPPSA